MTQRLNVFKSSRPVMTLVFVIMLVAVVSRSLLLEADPYTNFIPKDIGFHVDEGYKTLSPRNIVRFGTVLAHAADEYPGWMGMSPATQWPYLAAFSVAGSTDLKPARFVSVTFFALFSLGAVLFLSASRNAKAVLLATSLLASDIALFHFSRTAIFEIVLIFFVYSGIFLAFTGARREMKFYSISILALTASIAAVSVKLSAGIYLLPAIGGVLLSKTGSKRSNIVMALTGFVFLALFLVVTRDAWIERIDFAQPHALLSASLDHQMHLLSPLAMVLGYLSVITILCVGGISGLVRDPYRIVLTAIVVLVPIAFGLFPYSPPRYYVPIIPAAAFLVVEAVAVWNQRGNRGEKLDIWTSLAIAFMCIPFAVALQGFFVDYAVPRLHLPQGTDPGISLVTQTRLQVLFGTVMILLLVFARKIFPRIIYFGLVVAIPTHLALNISMQIEALTKPAFDARLVTERLEEIVAEHQFVAGDWAPFFTAGTHLRGIYMERRWNSAEDIQQIRPAFFIHSSVLNDEQNLAVLKRRDDLILERPIFLGEYHQHSINLYRISYTLN